jgi:hypothetical protein
MKIFRTFVLMLAALAMVSCSMPGYTGGQLPTDSLPVATTEVAATATLADTATPEPPTLTPTITETPTPEFTPTLSTPLVSAIDKNVLCRFGPGMEYGPSGSGELVTGVSAPILGKNDTVTWWQITNPKVETLKCWVDVNLTSASGDLASVPVVKDPLPFVTKAKVSASPSSISVPGCMGHPAADDQGHDHRHRPDPGQVAFRDPAGRRAAFPGHGVWQFWLAGCIE